MGKLEPGWCQNGQKLPFSRDYDVEPVAGQLVDTCKIISVHKRLGLIAVLTVGVRRSRGSHPLLSLTELQCSMTNWLKHLNQNKKKKNEAEHQSSYTIITQR